MKEKATTKNHGGEIIGGAIIEKRSLRRNDWKENPKEEIIEERGIWEASGRRLGGIREASRRHLGGIGEACRRHLGLQEAMGLQEAVRSNYCNTSKLKRKSCIKISI